MLRSLSQWLAAARGVGRRRPEGDAALARRIREHLGRRGPNPTVALLASGGARRAPGLVARPHRPVRIDATQPIDGLHVALTVIGPLDAIIVDAPPTAWPRLLRDVLLHLRPGGALFFRGVDARDRRRLVRSLQRLDRIRSGEQRPNAVGRRGEDQLVLAQAVARWRTMGRHVVVRRGPTAALPKLRHADVDAVLSESGRPAGRVLATVPGARFLARCPIEQSRSGLRELARREIDAPAVSLREYRDATCLPSQVVVQAGIILPDTYRHWHRARTGNHAVHDLAPRFGGLPEPADDETYLPGTYVHLDSEFQGHYGHLVTEQLSRMWAWAQIRDAAPTARVLMSTSTPRSELYPHERDLLDAFGISEEDVVLFDRPLRVERLLSATPMFSQPGFVHPGIAEAWRRVGDHLGGRATLTDPPRRIFCARPAGKRECRNSAEVESLFQDWDFELVRPERYPLADQAALFRGAEVIAGYSGAAMFSLCYAPEPKDVVLLVPESYTAQNEYLMAAVQGHRLNVVWCPSDVEQPARGFSAVAYQSSYVFDAERDAAWLAGRLAELTSSPRA